MFSISKFAILAAALVSTTLAAPTAPLSARAGAPLIEPIHPSADANKCVGIVGGKYADGTLVDVYDCNGSSSQGWQVAGGDEPGVTPIYTADQNDHHYCLDAGEPATWKNGAQVKIWTCYNNLEQQTWNKVSSGAIQLSNSKFCLDLTNGSTENRNVLQIWECAAGNKNQIWKIETGSQ